MMAYNKAICALLSSAVAILGGFGLDIGHWGSAEVITSTATIIGAGLVYAVPNR